MKQKNNGQALIEVLVALTIGVIIAGAFVSLGALSVRNSTFSSNQARATRLAEEGIEATITIRDQNTATAIRSFSTVDQWIELFDTSVNLSCPAVSDEGRLTVSCNGDFLLEIAPCTINTVQQRCIERNATAYTDPSWRLATPNTQFSRKIRITNTDADGDGVIEPEEITSVKNVTVFVWWNDASGRHESVLSRKLYRDKLQ